MDRREVLTGIGAAVLSAGPSWAAEKPRWMSPQLPRRHARGSDARGASRQAEADPAGRPAAELRGADRGLPHRDHAERSVLRALPSRQHSADGRSRQMVAHRRRRGGGAADHPRPRRTARRTSARWRWRRCASARAIAAACRHRMSPAWSGAMARWATRSGAARG